MQSLRQAPAAKPDAKEFACDLFSLSGGTTKSARGKPETQAQGIDQIRQFARSRLQYPQPLLRQGKNIPRNT
jgi:hypothetical protein